MKVTISIIAESEEDLRRSSEVLAALSTTEVAVPEERRRKPRRWEMAKEAAAKLGGQGKLLAIKDIVARAKTLYPDANERTLRAVVYAHCVNKCPAHDANPSRGRSWRDKPVFVTDGRGKYRLYDERKDRQVYDEQVGKHNFGG